MSNFIRLDIMNKYSEPLVKEFQDIQLNCVMTFSGECYQDRSTNPSKMHRMYIKKLSDKYLLRCVWDYRNKSFMTDYCVTGEYNLCFSFYAPSHKSGIYFGSSVVIEKDNLRKFVSANFVNKKDVDMVQTVMETQVYFYVMDNDDLYPMKITFKKNRGGLIPMFAEIELSHDLCDEWYLTFAKSHYQYYHGAA